MAQQRAGVTKAADKALVALKAAVAEPGTESNKKAAEAVVDLRRQFKHDGVTDWAGRSPGYRDLIERLYRQAEVPSDSASNMQANLRYHVGNVLRKVAPTEDIQALGMSTEGPLGRVAKNRQDGPPRGRRATLVVDTVVLTNLAMSAIRGLASVGQGPDVEASLRSIIDEALNVLGGQRNGV